MMRAAPTEEMRIFLCTQIADEARHVRFFNRFYDEVGVLEADQPPGPPGGDERAREPGVRRALRRDAQEPRRPARPPPRGPGDAGRGRDALPHGHRGHAGPHRPALHPRVQRGGRARCPASSRASTRSPATSTATWPSARASCARWRRRTRKYGEAITRTLTEVAPIADGVLQPKWYVEGETELLGATMEETRAFAMKALERRLKVIGLAPLPDARQQALVAARPDGEPQVGPAQVCGLHASATPAEPPPWPVARLAHGRRGSPPAPAPRRTA